MRFVLVTWLRSLLAAGDSRMQYGSFVRSDERKTNNLRSGPSSLWLLGVKMGDHLSLSVAQRQYPEASHYIVRCSGLTSSCPAYPFRCKPVLGNLCRYYNIDSMLFPCKLDFRSCNSPAKNYSKRDVLPVSRKKREV